MATHEHTINVALAEALSRTRSLWRGKSVVKAEDVGSIKGCAKRPDIVVSEPNVSPVVVECEVEPAASVEEDAVDRLGRELLPAGRRILSSLAVRMPARLRDRSAQALKEEIAAASDFGIAVYTGQSGDDSSRWPTSGWLNGGVVDLSILVQGASVPPAVIEEAADRLTSGVSEAAALVEEIGIAHPSCIEVICQRLRQPDGEQARRMAMAILANALVFHETLARGPGELSEVQTLDELKCSASGLSKSNLIDQWIKILQVNYWPIFDIARRILEVIPGDNAKPLIDRLEKTATGLVENRLMRSHDLTGSVFQRLIADRKFLAAFYTHPASAALLAGLAIRPQTTPAGGQWSIADEVTRLRVADLACGTGTLLSAAYRRISQLHEAAGGDAEILHPSMMAQALIGYDVLPAASHLTASMLAGAHPTVKYDRSSIWTLVYGRRDRGGVALGSLDLLGAQRGLETVNITAEAKGAGGKGERVKENRATLAHWSCDLVLMNPPFTRDTGHEGGKVGISNPMFAAFGSTGADQRLMSQALAALLKGESTVYHGNAGEASAFLALADRKLKDNGTLALVMPLSLMSGEAWEKSRQLLRRSYSSLVFMSIAGARHDQLSFSVDTGMGECLVVGKKKIGKEKRATFVVLRQRPDSVVVGAATADQIREAVAGGLRKLEDGPVGGSLIRFGDDAIGFAMDGPLPKEGPWNLVRMLDAALAQVAYQLSVNKVIWLPGMSKSSAVAVPISTVEGVGRVGPYHMDVNGNTSDGGIRGPFKIENLKGKAAPTYPVLWSHHAERERCMTFEADSEGVMRQGKHATEESLVRSKADRIWATASHCHFNRDFQFNSQSTAMQYCDRRTIGGRAWPSISLDTEDQEKALTLWANCTLGLLVHWWHANKEQAGRGVIGVSGLGSLPVLDIKGLNRSALSKAVLIFDSVKNRELRPINEIDKDPVRQEIDERVAADVLGLPPDVLAPHGPLALLREKLALEPSITGGKSE